MENSQITVWHDEENYKKIWKRGLPIFVVAAVTGVAVYTFFFHKYTDGYYASVILASIVFVALLFGLRKRIFHPMACFVKYDGGLFRLTDANRGITRLAGKKEIDETAFLTDFSRARRSNACWRICSVDFIEEHKKSYRIFCKICMSKSGKEKRKDFYVEKGFQELQLLLEELRQTKEESD